MSDDDTCAGVSEQFNPESRNGVYHFVIHSAFDGYVVVGGVGERTVVDYVRINGNYVGTEERFETECDDFEIEDGGLNLLYNTDSDRRGDAR